jgi:hypothetical protein
MMPILVLRASASSIKCDVRITALCISLAIYPITSHMNRLASGSIPADGSSSKIMGGLPKMAMATQTLRLFPPESVPVALSRWIWRPSFSMTSSMRVLRCFSGIPLIVAKYSMFYSTESVSNMALYWGQ